MQAVLRSDPLHTFVPGNFGSPSTIYDKSNTSTDFRRGEGPRALDAGILHPTLESAGDTEVFSVYLGQ